MHKHRLKQCSFETSIPGFPADLVHLTKGYASVFVLFVFKCGEMYVERGDGRVAEGDSEW